MTCSGREASRVNPFTVAGPAHQPGPDRRAGPRRVAGHRRRHPPRPARRRQRRPGTPPPPTAYAQLRTAWGRSEAYADLAADQPYVPAPAARCRSHRLPRLARAARLVPARIRHGRPWHLLARALAAAAAVAAGGGPAAGPAIRSRPGDGPGHLVRLHRARGPGPATRPVKEGVPWCAAGDFLATSRLRASRGDPCGRPAGQHRGQQPSCPARPGQRRACRPPTRSPPPAGHRPNNHPPLPPAAENGRARQGRKCAHAHNKRSRIPDEKRKAVDGL